MLFSASTKGDGKPRTAQATIPYEAIYPTVWCALTDAHLSKCIAFEDISYQLAQPETRTAIFEHLCDSTTMDASSMCSLLLNRKVDPVQYAKVSGLHRRGMILMTSAPSTPPSQKQLASGNNGIVETKYRDVHHRGRQPENARARADPHWP